VTYTPEQLAIIARMGKISARIDAVNAAHRAAHGAIGQNLLNLGRDLIAAIEHANEVGTLHQQHGDTFREFLDTL